MSGSGGATGGTAGTTAGTGGSTGGTSTGGTGGTTGGTGGTTGGTGGTTGGTGGTTGGTGGSSCTEGTVRNTCPNTQVCTGGTWIPYSELKCNACSIVNCPIDYPNCCSGFRASALTAGTFLPNPSAIKSFTTTTTSVSATFQFTQAYEVGSIDLLLPVEIPITALFMDYTFTGDTEVDFSLEYGDGKSGATYWDDFYGTVDLATPMFCFPQSNVCPSVANQINIRLRPHSAGSGTLTVTLIDIGT